MKWTAETSSFSSGRPQLLRAAILLDKIQQPFKIEIDGAHGSKIGARCKIKLLTEMLSLIWYERLELSEISEVLPFTSWAQTHGQKPFESELRKILPIYVGRDVTNDAFFHSIFELASFVTTDLFHKLTVIVVLNTTLKDCTVSFTKLNTLLVVFSKKDAIQ